MAEKPKTISKGYKYRIYPTKEQELAILHTFAASNYVYDQLVWLMDRYYKRRLKWYYRQIDRICRSYGRRMSAINRKAIQEGRCHKDRFDRTRADLDESEQAHIDLLKANRDAKLEAWKAAHRQSLKYLNPRRLAFVRKIAARAFDANGDPWLKYVTADADGNPLPPYVTKRKLGSRPVAAKADAGGTRFLAVSQAALNTAVNALNQGYANMYKNPRHFGKPTAKLSPTDRFNIAWRLQKQGRVADERAVYAEAVLSGRCSYAQQVQDGDAARARERGTSAKPVLEMFADERMRRIQLPGVFGTMKIRTHREPKGECTQMTISRDTDGKYYVSLSCVRIPNDGVPAASKDECAYEIGIADYLVGSDGSRFGHPGKLIELQRQIDRLNARKSHCQGGSVIPLVDDDGNPVMTKDIDGEEIVRTVMPPASKRCRKLEARIAKLQAKQARIRQHRLHLTTKAIVDGTQAVCIRQLDVKGMVHRESRRIKAAERKCLEEGRPLDEIPRRELFRQQEKNLNRAVHDSSFAEFRRQIEYKAAWAGRDVVEAPKTAPTTQVCHVCGHKEESLEGIAGLLIREWTCPDCGTHHMREENSAQNLLDWAHGRFVVEGEVWTPDSD